MPALAKIQPKRIDLVQLVKRSQLTEDQKAQWLEGLPTMTISQKGVLAKMLLDAEDRLVANTDKIVAEIHAGERTMWRAAEAKARNNEQRATNDILNGL